MGTGITRVEGNTGSFLLGILEGGPYGDPWLLTFSWEAEGLCLCLPLRKTHSQQLNEQNVSFK